MQIRTVDREQVSEWAKTSRAKGKDIGEVLDRAGVLLTPERLAAVRAICLEQIAQILEDTPVTYYTQNRQVTVPDFQALLATAIRRMATEEYERIKK